MIALQAPAFWRERNAWQSKLLAPLAFVYAHVARLRLTLSPQTKQFSIPIICVGNATLGGAGKTPVCRYVHDMLRATGQAKNPCVVMRGYRGSQKGPLLVTPTHSVADIGDEAVMQARHLPVIVGRNRSAAILYAIRMGFDAILTDDGLQSPFYRDFNLLVVDGPYGFGNGKVFPAGPLRMKLADTLARVDAVCVIGGGMGLPMLDKPSYEAQMRADSAPFPNQPVIAFAGLGRPEKFRETLYALDQPVQFFVPFPDHHLYTVHELESLARRGLPLLTTEKDWVRLPKEWQQKVSFLPVQLLVQNGEALVRSLPV